MQSAVPTTLKAALLAVLAALVLAACQPTRPDRAGSAELAARAESLEAQGDYAGAARAWRELADTSTGSARDLALLNLARSLQRDGRPGEGRQVLDEMGLPPAGQAGIEFALLSAELAIVTGDYEAGLGALDQLPPDLAGADKADALLLEAHARAGMGQTGEAVAALVRREAWLPAGQLDDNRRKIWNLLQQAAARGAPMTTPPGADDVTAGWMELGRMIEAYGGNPFQLQTALANWRQLNPDHPAGGAVLDDALGGYRELTGYPRQVALVLPLSGRLESSATAVRDGFIAAYYQQGGTEERPAVRVYDSARLGAAEAWSRAAADGADFVVGPLLKEEVEAIAGVATGLETLALNEPTDAELPGTVYRFALAPEDEASQAALRILADGRYRGIALVPEGDWGMRIAASFGETLQAHGGRLLEIATYVGGTADYSDTITRVLNVDQSDARHARLEGIIGMDLAFEARRRDDIDFIFLAAQPREGRLLRPQLRFHHAADLPVYSTSAIYETAGGGNNADLDGVIFDDAPWVLDDDPDIARLRREIAGDSRGVSIRRGRLYALGFDAYRLVPLIKNDRAALARGVPGLTGQLTMEADGRVRRELDWGRIVDGDPRPLEPARP